MFGSFYGWYLKCQSDAQTIAVIPAIHRAGSKRVCSIQVITDEGAWMVTFPAEQFRRNGSTIKIGKNRFSEEGIRLAVNTPELTINGTLDFGVLFPLRYDIMGPFAFVPFMECRHSVWSMRHTVWGMVSINGREYSFQNAKGYWEGDRGYSFPKRYFWTHCFLKEGSLMLSVADIPVLGFCFTGIIGIVLWKGREYRFATYLGAKIRKITKKAFQIIQGDMELEVELLETACQPLKAPTKGDMVRIIHESASCLASYRFQQKGHTIFAVRTNKASFEYEY